MISHVTAPPLTLERIEDLDTQGRPEFLLLSLRVLASEGLEVR